MALIPTRYPGSETSGGRPDRAGAQDRLGGDARRTSTAASASACSPPTPAKCPLMDVRTISLTGGPEETTDPRTIMAEQLPPQERLQPALLDRLTDDEPDKKQEPREPRVMSKSRLRQAVLRDLAWLFNATRLETVADLAEGAARAAVGRQLRPAGAVGTDGLVARRDRPRARRPAGDPRFRAAHPAGDAAGHGRCSRPGDLDHHNVIGIEIRGQLWAQPVPLEFLVRTEIDLETGKVRDRRSGPVAGGVMDPRLLRHYNLELQHLREMGAEFAEQFPKIAGRLGMHGLEVADPYVERLLEGVGFLAARVQLKLDAEFPRFTQALLEIVYPHYLAPTPSMLVAQLTPDPNDPNLADAAPTVPRGSPMQACVAADDATACEFRTAHDVTLWPVEIVVGELLLLRARSAAQHAADRASGSRAACASG